MTNDVRNNYAMNDTQECVQNPQLFHATHEDGEDAGASKKGKKKQKKKKQKKSKAADAEREFRYYKLEDEVFHQMAGSNWFTYRLEPTATGMIVERLVMLVPAPGPDEVYAQCQALMENPYEPADDA